MHFKKKYELSMRRIFH